MVIVLYPLISALSVNIPTGTSVGNYSGVGVNNSLLWNGHAFVAGAVSTIETDPICLPYVTNGTFVPYIGAAKNIDIGQHNLTTPNVITPLVSNAGDLAISTSGTGNLNIIAGGVAGGSIQLTTQNTLSGINLQAGGISGDINLLAGGDTTAAVKLSSGGNEFEVNYLGAGLTMDTSSLWTGAGKDLQLIHNGTDSKITNAVGKLYIDNSVGSGEVLIKNYTTTNYVKTLGQGGIVWGDYADTFFRYYPTGNYFQLYANDAPANLYLGSVQATVNVTAPYFCNSTTCYNVTDFLGGSSSGMNYSYPVALQNQSNNFSLPQIITSKSTDQLQIKYDMNNYVNFSESSAGLLSIIPQGSGNFNTFWIKINKGGASQAISGSGIDTLGIVNNASNSYSGRALYTHVERNNVITLGSTLPTAGLNAFAYLRGSGAILGPAMGGRYATYVTGGNASDVRGVSGFISVDTSGSGTVYSNVTSATSIYGEAVTVDTFGNVSNAYNFYASPHGVTREQTYFPYGSVTNAYSYYDSGQTNGTNNSWGFYGLSANNSINIDNGKWCFGTSGCLDSYISFDGTNQYFYVNNATSIHYFIGNVSADNLIDRSWYWDKSIGNSLDYVKDSDELKSDGIGFDDTKLNDFEKTTYQVTDFSRPIEEKYEVEVCKEVIINETSGETNVNCYNEPKIRTIYPYTKNETGRLISAVIGKHEQNIFDLLQKVTILEDENKRIKDCLINSKTFEEYQLCVIKNEKI
jgi:hypothetical protein